MDESPGIASRKLKRPPLIVRPINLCLIRAFPQLIILLYAQEQQQIS
jgi:hypothetical protein